MMRTTLDIPDGLIADYKKYWRHALSESSGNDTGLPIADMVMSAFRLNRCAFKAQTALETADLRCTIKACAGPPDWPLRRT